MSFPDPYPHHPHSSAWNWCGPEPFFLSHSPVLPGHHPFNTTSTEHQDTQDSSQSTSDIPGLAGSTCRSEVKVSFSSICLQMKHRCLQEVVNMHCQLGEKITAFPVNTHIPQMKQRFFFLLLSAYCFLEVSFPQMFNKTNTKFTEMPPDVLVRKPLTVHAQPPTQCCVGTSSCTYGNVAWHLPP